eukprot:3163872-Prymnesium_polylepis.2
MISVRSAQLWLAALQSSRLDGPGCTWAARASLRDVGCSWCVCVLRVDGTCVWLQRSAQCTDHSLVAGLRCTNTN